MSVLSRIECPSHGWFQIHIHYLSNSWMGNWETHIRASSVKGLMCLLLLKSQASLPHRELVVALGAHWHHFEAGGGHLGTLSTSLLRALSPTLGSLLLWSQSTWQLLIFSLLSSCLGEKRQIQNISFWHLAPFQNPVYLLSIPMV